MDIDLSKAKAQRVTELDFELQEQKAKIEDKAIMVTSKEPTKVGLLSRYHERLSNYLSSV